MGGEFHKIKLYFTTYNLYPWFNNL